MNFPPSKFGTCIYRKQYTLRYPETGGPEHSVILCKIRGKEPIIGIDNGFLGGDDHIIDPTDVIKKPGLPPETINDIEDAVDDFLPRAKK